jgi:peptidoglycan-N-acetylglucosamine deacetylase
MSQQRWGGFIVIVLVMIGVFISYTRPDIQLMRPQIYRNNTDQKVIAITFDRGPYPLATPLVLETLARTKTPATFFFCGENARQYPQLVRRTQAANHEIGSHAYSFHATMQTFTATGMQDDIRRGDEIIREITGNSIRLFRPPGGHITPALTKEASRYHYTIVGWSDDPKDLEAKSAEAVTERVLANLQPGEILLLHDYNPLTAQALVKIIPAAHARGYRFITVSELIELDTTPTRK